MSGSELNEQSPADALAEEAGFADESPVAVAATETPAEAPTPVASEAQEAPVYAQIKQSDWDALVARAGKLDEVEKFKSQMDTAFGHIGAMKQRLDGRTTRPAFDPEKFKAGKTASSLGEEYAAELAADIAASIGEQEFDPAPFQQQLDERVQAVVSQFQQHRVATELKLLSVLSPGWKDLAYVGGKEEGGYTPEFLAHLNAQPKDIQDVLTSATDFDAEKAADVFRLFKEQQKPAAASDTPQAKPVNPRTQRIAAAVTPRGSAPAPTSGALTEDEAFNSA